MPVQAFQVGGHPSPIRHSTACAQHGHWAAAVRARVRARVRGGASSWDQEAAAGGPGAYNIMPCSPVARPLLLGFTLALVDEHGHVLDASLRLLQARMVHVLGGRALEQLFQQHVVALAVR